MTRLTALSRFLSHCHRLVPAILGSVWRTDSAGGLASHRSHKSPSRVLVWKVGINRIPVKWLLARLASLGGWMRFSFVKTEEQRHRGA